MGVSNQMDFLKISGKIPIQKWMMTRATPMNWKPPCGKPTKSFPPFWWETLAIPRFMALGCPSKNPTPGVFFGVAVYNHIQPGDLAEQIQLPIGILKKKQQLC